jgi:hypothetical protein
MEVPTARKMAQYLEELADLAERTQIKSAADNIQTMQKIREDLANAKKASTPEG